MLIALTGDKDTSTLDMRQLAEYKLRTRLLAIPGVDRSRCWAAACRNTRWFTIPSKLKLAGWTFPA